MPVREVFILDRPLMWEYRRTRIPEGTAYKGSADLTDHLSTPASPPLSVCPSCTGCPSWLQAAPLLFANSSSASRACSVFSKSVQLLLTLGTSHELFCAWSASPDPSLFGTCFCQSSVRWSTTPQGWLPSDSLTLLYTYYGWSGNTCLNGCVQCLEDGGPWRVKPLWRK